MFGFVTLSFAMIDTFVVVAVFMVVIIHVFFDVLDTGVVFDDSIAFQVVLVAFLIVDVVIIGAVVDVAMFGSPFSMVFSFVA